MSTIFYFWSRITLLYTFYIIYTCFLVCLCMDMCTNNSEAYPCRYIGLIYNIIKEKFIVVNFTIISIAAHKLVFTELKLSITFHWFFFKYYHLPIQLTSLFFFLTITHKKIFYSFSFRKGIQFNSTYFNFRLLEHTIHFFHPLSAITWYCSYWSLSNEPEPNIHSKAVLKCQTWTRCLAAACVTASRRPLLINTL